MIWTEFSQTNMKFRYVNDLFLSPPICKEKREQILFKAMPALLLMSYDLDFKFWNLASEGALKIDWVG